MKLHLQRLLYASLVYCGSILISPTLHAQDITFCQSISINGNIGTLHVYAVYEGTGIDEEFASYGVSVYFDRTPSEFLSIDYNENLWDECYYKLNPFVRQESAPLTLNGVNYPYRFYATGADMKPSSDGSTISTTPIWLFDAHFDISNGGGVVATAVGTINASDAFYDHYDNTCYDITIKPLEAVEAEVKVFLQGPLSGTMMNTALSPSLLPLSQPYTGAPHNYTGTENIAVMPSNIVDWVLVELRDDVTPTMIVARKAALLQADGNVMDVSGSTTLIFDGVNPGQYYLSVRHRNHLAVMSQNAINFTSSTN